MSIKAYQIAKEWAGAPKRTVLYITASEERAGNFKTDLEFFTSGRAKGEVCLFPAPDSLPYSRLAVQQDIWIDRLKVLFKLFCGEAPAIAAPIEAVLRGLPPKWIFEKYRRTIHLHDTINKNELAGWLSEAGYLNQPLVEDEGTFAARGGIIDIFTPTLDRPARIELDGDEIVSIRSFDPATQKSSFGINSFTIIPVRNVILNKETTRRAVKSLKELCDRNDTPPSERRQFAEEIGRGFYAHPVETLMPLFYDGIGTLFEYLPKDAFIYLDDKIEIEAEAKRFWERLKNGYETARGIEKIIRPEELYTTQPGEFIANGHEAARIEIGAEERLKLIRFKELHKSVKDPFRSISGQILEWQRDGFRVIIVCHTATQGERLLDLLKWSGLSAELTDRSFLDVLSFGRSVVWIMTGRLSGGFFLQDDRLILLTDEDIFGTKISKRPAPSETLETFTDFSQLSDGDYVIHKDHGIGRYMGLKNLEIGGTRNDFIELHYLGGDKLLLPVWRINLISRYIGAGGNEAALDRLGGTRWAKREKKVNAAVRTMAIELLKVYAARKVNKGHAFSPRDHLLEEFEAGFPYDETPDQLRAIDETLRDMQKEEPSDRLICGDVGYGKTEVAMRAAFKAVADKKQAAILVPTTVLAFQHYENFMARFADWPVRIEMLSRFRQKSEQRHVVTELARGMVDIVIGTHRLLQRDIKFGDLGLLIIDEEHRFGVAHKERIRKLKATVDTITMTATPIPRTLHLSLSGIRDISVINTPPANRLAIRTYVTEFDEDIIRGAIISELTRGGQVFFVHNRIETIEKMHDLLKKLVPEAGIVVGHGRMDEHELEDVMIKFLEKKANLLLSTTIIESGLDVPSANTIIINRADTMGLAQLYQLRGRVGRSNVQAYAYLLTPSGGDVNPTAAKRLALLQRYTELGSGFQISMHDLEIRGAGNILGARQSGHINAIGYEMYARLLERAIRQLQGRPEEPKPDVEISLPVPAYIPADYIEDEGLRLVFYRRMAEIDSTEGLDLLSKELEDRFGRLPTLLKNLLKIVEVRIMACGLWIESIQYDGRTLAFRFNSRTPVRPEAILAMVKSDPRKYSFKPPSSLLINEQMKETQALLSAVRTMLAGKFQNH